MSWQIAGLICKNSFRKKSFLVLLSNVRARKKKRALVKEIFVLTMISYGSVQKVCLGCQMLGACSFYIQNSWTVNSYVQIAPSN